MKKGDFLRDKEKERKKERKKEREREREREREHTYSLWNIRIVACLYAAQYYQGKFGC